MKKKRHLIFVTITLCFFSLLFCLILSGQIFGAKVAAINAEKTRNESLVEIDWESLYPYDTQVEEVEQDSSVSDTSHESIFDKYRIKISKLGTLGNDWSKKAYGYTEIARVGYVIKSKLADPSIGNTYS